MYYLIFYDYKDEVKKISLTRLLKKERNLSLTDAKNAIDKLIEGTPIIFSFKEKSLLEQLQKEAMSMGVKCKISDSVFIRKRIPVKRNIVKKHISADEKRIQKEYSKALMY